MPHIRRHYLAHYSAACPSGYPQLGRPVNNPPDGTCIASGTQRPHRKNHKCFFVQDTCQLVHVTCMLLPCMARPTLEPKSADQLRIHQIGRITQAAAPHTEDTSDIRLPTHQHPLDGVLHAKAATRNIIGSVYFESCQIRHARTSPKLRSMTGVVVAVCPACPP